MDGWVEERKEGWVDGWMVHPFDRTAKDLLSHICGISIFPLQSYWKSKVQGFVLFCFVFPEKLSVPRVLLSQFWEKQSKSFWPHLMDKEIKI